MLCVCHKAHVTVQRPNATKKVFTDLADVLLFAFVVFIPNIMATLVAIAVIKLVHFVVQINDLRARLLIIVQCSKVSACVRTEFNRKSQASRC